MPNCPVCGRDVPAGTKYCPTCGTNLQKTSFGSQPTQSPQYPQNPSNYPTYSYPQPGGTEAPSQNQQPGRRRRIVVITAALIIGLVIGTVIGLAQPIPADFTTVNGTANLNSRQMTTYHGTPNLIMFNSTTFGNLTSSVVSNKFLVNLPVGDTYLVSIQWLNATSTYRCIPTTTTFTSNNRNETPTFSC